MKYKLPIASENTLGGIKVGDDFEIDSETGVLNIKDMSIMQERLDDLVPTVAEGKALLAEAITEKGIETSPDATFQTMHDNVLQISGGVSFTNIDAGYKIVEYEVITE